MLWCYVLQALELVIMRISDRGVLIDGMLKITKIIYMLLRCGKELVLWVLEVCWRIIVRQLQLWDVLGTKILLLVEVLRNELNM
jgi:hypothetical protein